MRWSVTVVDLNGGYVDVALETDNGSVTITVDTPRPGVKLVTPLSLDQWRALVRVVREWPL